MTARRTMFALGTWLLATACTPPPPPPEPTCPIEPAHAAIFDLGDVPLVITSIHAGTARPQGCADGTAALRNLTRRDCTPELDEVCESGPCRAFNVDRGLRPLTFALVKELERCLGGRPSLALAEVSRKVLDMNRDPDDRGGGLRCAMQDPAALPYWQAFHDGVEQLVQQAASQGGSPLLIDLHTYNTLEAAPPPAVMLGAGNPFGMTMPRLTTDDPTLQLVFGKGGLRARLLAELQGIADGTLMVHPPSVDASLEELFSGRYILQRYSRLLEDDTRAGPMIDALQIEVSSGLRDEPELAAAAIADAICASFGDRLTRSR